MKIGAISEQHKSELKASAATGGLTAAVTAAMLPQNTKNALKMGHDNFVKNAQEVCKSATREYLGKTMDAAEIGKVGFNASKEYSVIKSSAFKQIGSGFAAATAAALAAFAIKEFVVDKKNKD